MSQRHLSRQAQAFEALLAPDSNDEGARQGSGRKGRRASGRDSLPSRSGPIQGFRLRGQNDAAASPTPAPGPSAVHAGGLTALLDLFGGTLPPDIIEDVFHACGDSQEVAIDALLAMSGGEATQPPPPAPSGPSPKTSSPAQSSQINLWDTLPQECKLLILDKLSLKDLAAAAPVSREFAAHVAAQRGSLRRVVVPPGLSPPAVRGLVASFTAAAAVDFSRCARFLRFASDFEDAARAVAAGAAARPPGSAPVEELSLARSGAIGDGDVAAITATLRTLRRVDLSRCPQLGDPSLATLARYRRSVENADDEESEEAGPGEAAAAMAAAMAAVTLETPAEAVERVAAARRAARAAASEAAAAAAGGLEDISVAGSGVTTRGVGELLRGSGRAPSLLVLDVSRCAKVTGDALVPGPTSLLRVLRAAGCPALHSISLALPAGSSLREITLADCKSLREVIITSAPALEELNVSGCGQLTTMALRCPALRRLRASGCARLALGAAPFECPSLQSLNLFGCRAIETAGLEAALPGAPSLIDLDLSGCVGLGRVVATVEGGSLSMLRVLRLDGCALLRVVALAAPGLRSLSARACVRLMELRLVGASPLSVDLENCGELREASLGGGGGGSGSGGGGSGSREEEGEEHTRRLVLRGCNRLPQEARDRLRQSVLGPGGGGGGPPRFAV